MLERLRQRINIVSMAVGRKVAEIGILPMHLTILGLLSSFAASFFYSLNQSLSLLYASLFLLLSGLFDLLDGSVARASGRVTKGGAFLDSTLDRVAEVAIYTGIVVGGRAEPVSSLLALSFSLLVSYTRARAESLGITLAGIGIGERSERMIVLFIFSLIGFVQYGVYVVILISSITFIQRILYTLGKLR